MEKAAAFLEARRYLAYLNGTVEFSKWYVKLCTVSSACPLATGRG